MFKVSIREFPEINVDYTFWIIETFGFFMISYAILFKLFMYSVHTVPMYVMDIRLISHRPNYLFRFGMPYAVRSIFKKIIVTYK